MNGTVFDIKRFAIHDGPGIRTTVFLQGCPLNCNWCHNPESREPDPCTAPNAASLRQLSVHQVMAELEKDRLFYDESGGGVTFSGGEPLLQHAFLGAVLAACSEKDLHTAVDTSGYCEWDIMEPLLAYTRLWLFDIKHMNPEIHVTLTGVDNAPILKNLRQLNEAGARIWIRIPTLQGLTDTPENLGAVADFCRQLEGVQQINVLPWHPGGLDKRKRYGLHTAASEPREPDTAVLETAVQTLRTAGKPVRIGG